MDDLLAKYSRVIEQVDFLLRTERTGRPNSLNKRLTENLHTWYTAFLPELILIKTLTWTFNRRQERKASSLEDVITLCKDRAVQTKWPSKVQNSGSDADRIVLELHNTLKSYYAVVLDRLVDNVCMQAADFFLVTGEESPMSLFPSSFVSSLTNEQLEEITGEDTGLKRRSAQLMKKIQELEMRRKTLV
jgi:hypothetical protein